MPYTYRFPHPAVATDAIVFTVRDGRLEVLLIRRRNEPFQGMWAFPGGYLDLDEDLQACAERELAEETGIRGVTLQQFHAAGKPDRDPRERNISILHMGLVRPDQLRPVAGDDASAVAWFPARRPPALAFDHRELLALARRHLNLRLQTSAAALRFLPPRFTLPALQAVYEAVAGRRLAPVAFRRQARTMDYLVPTGETAAGRHGRQRLYRAAGRGTP